MTRQPKLFVPYDDAGADFDEPQRVYRYRLWRWWKASTVADPRRGVLWIMLNPSTADEHVLDPTLRRCEQFSRDWGYDGFVVVNLFAFRSPHPKHLYGRTEPIEHMHHNFRQIETDAGRAALIICGWGGEHIARGRARAVCKMLRASSLSCLGTNGDGSPKHPLYLSGALRPESFEGVDRG